MFHIKYMGSKARIAKNISPIINQAIQNTESKIYIEPFVGGANMIEHIKCESKIGLDNNKYLIEFWNELQNGWNPLDNIQMTKELYDDVKTNKDNYFPCVVALTGLCATYNAKWFGGYAGIVHTKANTERNYYNESVRNVLKQINQLKDVRFKTMDYKDIESQVNATIYCDPPYQGTTKYQNEFNHEEFWEWVRKMSQDNNVFVSEYNAPDDFECIWQKELTTTLDKNSRSKSVEKLFIYKKS